MNKSAYNTGVVAALLDAGLLKSADANALAKQLQSEQEPEKRPGQRKKRPTIPEYEDEYFNWGGRSGVANSMLENLGIDVRGPTEENY